VKKSRWSPADLDRQRLVVRRIKLRSELDLRTLAVARVRLVAAVHRQIGLPLALAGAFVAGMMAGPRASPQRAAVSAQTVTGRLWHFTTLFKTAALAATAYNTLFRDDRGSASTPGRRTKPSTLPARKDLTFEEKLAQLKDRQLDLTQRMTATDENMRGIENEGQLAEQLRHVSRALSRLERDAAGH
jgi:hypothetical protein